MTPVLPTSDASAGDEATLAGRHAWPRKLRLLAEKTLPLPNAARTGALLFGEGASVGLLVWATLATSILPYSLENDISPEQRRILIVTMLGCGMAALAIAVLFLARAEEDASSRLELGAVRLCPLLFVGLLPFLFRWQIWVDRQLTFGVFVCAGGFAFHASALACLRAGNRARHGQPSRVWAALGAWLQRRAKWAAPTLVALAGVYYAVFFSYETVLHHHSVLTTSFDLGLEDNVLWNVVHGGPFMKMSPLFGPVGSHFGYHAALFAYAIAPFYALHQQAETLLIFQAALVGAAGIPLYLFAARHIGRWPACLVALAYLLYPPVHGANLYDFHYPPLGVFFIWLTLYLVDSGRNRWAILSLVLTLSVREDIAADTAILGVYLLFSGKARAGVVITAVAGTYFLIVKLVLMPPFLHGDQSFLNQSQGLIGRGTHGYGGVVMTVIGNPVYTLTNLLEPDKFLYIVQLAAPLCFFPWRRPIGYLLSIPGFFFTLLETKYPPLVQISFQYTAHWTAFLFVALVANLEWVRAPKYPTDNEGWLRQRAWLIALCALTIVTSFQYGAIFQQHTARGGFGPYQFGQSDAAAADYRALRSLIARVPPRAKISSSELVVPHVSNRPDSYTLRVGVFDAKYLLFQLPSRDDERREARAALEHGFGVVAQAGPFVLAERGHPETQNGKVLRQLR
jgi:uncharacterized membrane protein